MDKIAMFCQVEPEQVIGVHNVPSTYHVPLLLEQQGLVRIVGEILQLDGVPKGKNLIARGQATWIEWQTLTMQQDRLFETVSIALVGKYTALHDSYLSVVKSLEHSAMRCGKKLNLIWVESSDLEESTKLTNTPAFHKAWHEVCTANGILVPGGFAQRGTEGMIAAAKWAREQKLHSWASVSECSLRLSNLPVTSATFLRLVPWS
jgi:CTP synthase